MEALKHTLHRESEIRTDGRLAAFGYEPSDFQNENESAAGVSAGGLFLAGIGCFLLVLWISEKRQKQRLDQTAEYLERVRDEKEGVLWQVSENSCSRLQDQIYKTVTELYQTREEAVRARDCFAENLANIAHQLKTPVTALSLSVQMMEEEHIPEYPDRLRRQIDRLLHLEEALLLLARIDAGVLKMHRRKTDAFTILMLASENLQELSEREGVTVEVPELGAAELFADPNWMMEAVMNLMKNALEHTPRGGRVRCTYEKNPLYVQIRIQDEGSGFSDQDLPHLFERFYRGRDSKEGGAGIGLALARELLELQKGMVSARNLPEGGACFEIRMYCH